VLLVDDDPNTRSAIRLALERHDQLEVVAETDRIDDLLTQVRQHDPLVVLLDAELVEVDELPLLVAILEAARQTKMVLRAAAVSGDLRAGAVAAGVAGVVLTGQPMDEVAATLMEVCGLQ
jgi:DNA-binding NarL/FixJ family response regulator